MSIQYNLYVYTVKNHCTSNPVVQAQYISSWLNSNEALKYDRGQILWLEVDVKLSNILSVSHTN